MTQRSRLSGGGAGENFLHRSGDSPGSPTPASIRIRGWEGWGGEGRRGATKGESPASLKPVSPRGLILSAVEEVGGDEAKIDDPITQVARSKGGGGMSRETGAEAGRGGAGPLLTGGRADGEAIELSIARGIPRGCALSSSPSTQYSSTATPDIRCVCVRER